MSSGAVRRVFPYAATAVVAATVVAALVIMGSPAEERRRRLDAIRRSDLAALAGAVQTYWRAEGRLPDSLAALDSVPGAQYRSRVDPASGEPYRFRVLGSSSYELCASFDRAGGDSAYEDRFWAHPPGDRCFRLDARKRE